MHGLCRMYKPQMKADKGSPSRGGHSKNPCISLRFSNPSSRPRNPVAGRRRRGGAPGRLLPQSTPAGVVATESLSCLCILGRRLRFNVGFAVSDGHSRDQVTGPVTPPVACDSDSESSSSSSSHLNSARSRSLTAGKVCSWLTFTFSQLHLCELEEMYHDWHVSVCIG